MLDAVPAVDGLAGAAGLAALVPLAAELCDLKRLRDASTPDSLASRSFRRAWGALLGGQKAGDVARIATADALAATRLGGIDMGVLENCGLSRTEATAVLRQSFDEVAAPVDHDLARSMRAALGEPLAPGPVPAFAEALIRQPRAGATCPGKPRIVLEPPEGHGDHCFVVAVLAYVLAPRFEADPPAAFLAGMAHHLHNSVLPDSGFAGEVLLGEHLTPVLRRLFDRELATLPAALRSLTADALAAIPDASTPVGRAFHAADVIDRVLQMQHYDQVARFTVDQALDDMDLVHAGPTQAFHHAVLRDAALP
jgi:5'-deoxynucleotidase YfbR-like HD superfamily hydrolase